MLDALTPQQFKTSIGLRLQGDRTGPFRCLQRHHVRALELSDDVLG